MFIVYFSIHLTWSSRDNKARTRISPTWYIKRLLSTSDKQLPPAVLHHLHFDSSPTLNPPNLSVQAQVRGCLDLEPHLLALEILDSPNIAQMSTTLGRARAHVTDVFPGSVPDKEDVDVRVGG